MIFRPSRQTGAALVVVLSLLLLLTVLALAFFMTVETEVQNSASTRNLALLRQLGDLPVQIVETQIRAATTNGQTGAASSNSWTSQPGLLRVHGPTGALVRAYKLYSSATLDTDDDRFIGSEIPEDWPDHPNQWVNLNEPSLSLMQPGRKIWPVFNPGAADWAEGVALSADPAGKTDAPMPVEWLYVLADGSVVPQAELSAARLPVGRIAFWTDDESCKININTAGERTMWDRPRSYHELREKYGRNQPSTGEFNAYPGHPATVCLSAALGKALTGESENDIVKAMLSLTPRYRWGGSENGTRTIWDRADEWKTGNIANVNKQERLYATPPEFLLNVARGVADERLREPIEESGFVLTESSRAPELNLFGMPRVGIWPIDTDTGKQTAYDKLIARCLTIGEKPFYFQRSNPLSDSEASIARNTGLLAYLDRLTQKTVNGFGGSFEAKWGTDERRQILTEIFDYVRGATNLSDTSRSTAEYSRQFTPALSLGRGFVVPTKIPGWKTHGLGRAPVLTHAALVFYAYEQKPEVKPKEKPEDPKEYLYDTKVHAMLWFNFFTPMHGLAPFSTRYRVEVASGPLPLRELGAPGYSYLAFRGGTSSRFYFPRNNQDPDWGGYNGMLIHGGTTMGGFAGYEFHSSAPVTIKGPGTGPAMEFGGGPMTIKLIDDASGTTLQTYEINFTSCITPLPLLWAGRWATDSDGVAYFNVDANKGVKDDDGNVLVVNPLEISQRVGKIWDTGARNGLLGWRVLETNPAVQPRLQPVDVIRTMELKDGDARIVAGLDTIDASFFTPGFGYQDGNRRISGSLLLGRTSPVREQFNKTNELLAQYGRQANFAFKSSYNLIESAILPKFFNGTEVTSLRAVGWAGDIDNGFLGEPDGPYANKPDEGHTLAESVGTGLPYCSTNAIYLADGQRLTSWDPRISGFFSPTRQVPSPVMFGSLPAGVKRTEAAYRSGKLDAARPWETLLFSPNPQAAMVADGSGKTGHPGANAPKDHLLLDLFTMPVVEPYAISEPFSTAGKINLNQRLIPFTYLKRETGLYGVLKNLEFMAVPNTDSLAYRSNGSAAKAIRKVDVARTLREVAKVLDPGGETAKGVFRSASEICDVFLVPQDQTGTGVVNWTTGNPAAFWSAHQLTGDNSREAPYNYLYPLLTTQSNTYQVHYRVQTLQPLKAKAGFDPANDFAVTGEQRGSFVIERYLDSNDPRFSGSSPEVDVDTEPLTPCYQFRTLRHQRFVPGL